jgi:hypothetical protein
VPFQIEATVGVNIQTGMHVNVTYVHTHFLVFNILRFMAC